MKYSEAKKQIKALSSDYTIVMSDSDFNIWYAGSANFVAYVSDMERYVLAVYEEKVFESLPFSDKLYRILSELAVTPLDERRDIKKYRIKTSRGCLGFVDDNGCLGMLPIKKIELGNMPDVKTIFTDDEIEELKRRDDVPLNWDKVTVEEEI